MIKTKYEELMKLTFKGSFMANLMVKLLSNEITPDEYKKFLSAKKNEISLRNKSSTEQEKYIQLMLEADSSTDSQPTIIPEKAPEKNIQESLSIPKTITKNLTFYYILILVSTLSLSMFMTGLNIKFGKTLLVNDEETLGNQSFRILEEAEQKNIEVELTNEQKDLKLNLNKNSFLIMPKMKKIILPTLEGLFGFIIKYGLSIFNVNYALFGRFFDSKNIRWLKIRVAIIFTMLPIIRIYMLHNINNDFLNNYNNQKIEFYKSKEIFQYNPKALPYNLYNEIAASLFSIFLALNHALPFIVDAFYKSNNFACESIKKIFNLKNKKS